MNEIHFDPPTKSAHYRPAFKSTTHRERYVHLRNLTPWPLKNAQARTVFLREESPGVWNFSYADCSNQDQFNRRTGRTTARRRYFQHEFRNMNLQGTEPTFEEVVAQVLRYLPRAG